MTPRENYKLPRVGVAFFDVREINGVPKGFPTPAFYNWLNNIFVDLGVIQINVDAAVAETLAKNAALARDTEALVIAQRITQQQEIAAATVQRSLLARLEEMEAKLLSVAHVNAENKALKKRIETLELAVSIGA